MTKYKNLLVILSVFFATLLIALAVSYSIVWQNTSPKNQTASTTGNGATQTKPGLIDLGEGISVEKVDSKKYKTVQTKPGGWFQTGQAADMMLSGIDFNNAGEPLLFNHPGGIATDGERLILADRNNNRVLIWNKLPSGNNQPDLVLGQKDFKTNNPGAGLENFNWPVAVATDGQKLVVGDTYNDRLLIWTNLPTQNGQAADLEIKGEGNANPNQSANAKRQIGWPWAVWTNGQKLVVTSTAGAKVLIWNSFPTQNNQPADVVLTAQGNFGTPRSIISDGEHLLIGDHNAKVNNDRGNFVWNNFPTKDDEPYNFFLPSAQVAPDQPPPPQGQNQGQVHGEIFWGGAKLKDDQFIILGDSLYVYDRFPQSDKVSPSFKIGETGPMTAQSAGFRMQAGDGSGLALADEKLYLSLSNGNKIIGFNKLPTQSTNQPDFVVGSPDIETNTLETKFIMSNPIPATDGKSLIVTSDFDRKVYVYKNLPNESGAHPDLIYYLPDGGWQGIFYEDSFMIAGKQSVFIWEKPPIEPKKPDLIFRGGIGNLKFQELNGVAQDAKYFYLSDYGANKVYIFEGLPNEKSKPKYTLSIKEPWRLSSDGQYLAVTTTLNMDSKIKIYKVSELDDNAKPVELGGLTNQIKFNLPQSSLVAQGHLFVADTGFNRVLIWQKIEDALAQKNPDVILGAENLEDLTPEIGQNKLFWPAGLAFDGSYLWVGEFKFSERLLRFSVR